MAQAIVWTSPSGLLLLWLQVAILALVCHWLGRLRQRVLRSQLDVQKRAAQGLQPQGDDGADFLPTVDSLQTEIPKTKGKNAPPRPAEWAPLTEEELEEYIILKAVRDYNHSKFATEEHVIIEGIIKDIFQGAVPDLDKPVQDYGNLKEAIH